MPQRYRIPITTITVFGASTLLAITDYLFLLRHESYRRQRGKSHYLISRPANNAELSELVGQSGVKARHLIDSRVRLCRLFR